MKRRTWTIAEINRLRASYAVGVSVAAIAANFGRSATAIVKQACGAGVGPRAAGGGMSQLDLLPVAHRPLPAPGALCWFREGGRTCALLVRRLDGAVRAVVASVCELGGARG